MKGRTFISTYNRVLILTTALAILVLFGSNALALNTDALKRIYYLDNEDHLCSVMQDGTNNICYEKAATTFFSFSPDGQYVAFLSKGKAITLIKTESHNKRVLVPDSNYKYTIEWSPDSKYIAYVVSDEDTNKDGQINWLDKCSINIVSLETGNVNTLVKSRADLSSTMFWSKDGMHIYYSRYSGDKFTVKYQLVSADVQSKRETIISEKSDNIISDIKCSELHFNQHNNSDQYGKHSDYSPLTGKAVSEFRGEIFLSKQDNDKKVKLIEHKDYDFKQNEGYFNPGWLTDKDIIFVGREPLKRASFFSRIDLLHFRISDQKYIFKDEAIFIFNIETMTKRELINGGSPGWYMNPLIFEKKELMQLAEEGICKSSTDK